VTFVTNMHMHAVFHKTRETDNFDVVLLQINWSIHVPITISL